MSKEVGISGFAVYVPPYRVDLEDWCEWTGAQWDKTSAVIGNSFRMRGPHQSVYTMAATSVMRLIDNYQIDPRRVGFLGLGTESSTDNSAGAVIVKGMIDEALRARGMPPINRHCEVPELKHACLGGVYAMKHGLRYLALEDQDRCAIVVSADIAEYARGSSGEPTQGAGAVAMLLESDPDLLEVDLRSIGSASAYRAVDFRKPVMRNLIRGKLNCHFQDLPVFNGKYSTTCYLDENPVRARRHVAQARIRTRRLLSKPGGGVHASTVPPHADYVVRHELSVRAGHNGAAGIAELDQHCQDAGMDVDAVLEEMRSKPDVLQLVRDGDIDMDVYPLSVQLLKEFRKSELFTAQLASQDVARLRADEGHRQRLLRRSASLDGGRPRRGRAHGRDLTGGKILAVGYGSGDAAEAIPMTLARQLAGCRWQDRLLRSARAAAEPDAIAIRKPSRHGHCPGSATPRTASSIESVGAARTRTSATKASSTTAT